MLRYRHRLVASPAYLERVQPPRHPRDLQQHRLVAFVNHQEDRLWSFVHTNGKEHETITVIPTLGTNDFAGVVPALLEGAGIGDLPPVVQPEVVRSGRLVEVMPEWHRPLFDLCLVHLGKRNLSRPVRLFKELALRMAPQLFPDLPT